MKRMAVLYRLKPHCVQQYLDYHQNVWPEVLENYRRNGITQCVCFLNGVDLIVYSEYDEAVYPASRATIAAHEAEQRWSKLMQSLMDSSTPPRECTEVFRMSNP